MDTRALGILLLLVGKLGFKAGDLAGQLRAVELPHGRARLGLGLAFPGLGLDLLRLGGLGRDRRLLWRRRYLGPGGRRRRDLVDLGVLERRKLGGLGHGLLVQGAAALLVVLRLEISLFRRLFALERGQGDVHGAADLRRLDHGKAHSEDQRQVHQRCQKQREAQPVHRANAGRQQVGGDVSGQRHQVSRGIVELQTARDSQQNHGAVVPGLQPVACG